MNYPPPNQPIRPGQQWPPPAQNQPLPAQHQPPLPMTPPAPQRAAQRQSGGVWHVLGKIAKWSGLSLAWMFQYCLWIPMVLFGRMCLGAMKLGLLGFFLLFIPVIGWAIIAVKVFGSSGPRRPGPSIWKPWGTR